MATKAAEDSAQIGRKSSVVDEIKAKLADADAAVLTEYRGLTVTQLASLRAALRPAATEYKVFKNTLARRAAEESGRADLLPLLEGPVAIAFVRGDAVVAAKALRDFAATSPALVVKGALLADRLLEPAEVEALADVPPRDELLARLAGGMRAPMTRAAGLFQSFTRGFAHALQGYVDQRVAAGGPAPADAPGATEAGEDAAPDAATGGDAAPPEASEGEASEGEASEGEASEGEASDA
jgi:large subunit ribosomal protein L10